MRSLRRQRANALALQIEGTAARTFGSISDLFLSALTLQAQQHDAHLIPFVAEDDRAVLLAYEQLLAGQMVDGIVLTNTRRGDPRPDWLREHGVPFVSFGRIWDEPEFTAWVHVDGRAGAAAGVRHLLEQGYGRIAYLGWPDGSAVGDDRRSGWAAASAAVGRSEPGLSATCRQDITEAEEVATGLLRRLQPGDAVVCVSDTVALGAALAVSHLGLVPGEDIGVLGFDDCDFTSAFGLSSVRQPVGDIARQLLSLLELDEPPDRGILMGPEVVQRDSTRRRPP